MSDMFECVCQFFQQQSAALQGIMQGLGNQNTISDIGGDGGQLPQVNTGGVLGQVSLSFVELFLNEGASFRGPEYNMTKCTRNRIYRVVAHVYEFLLYRVKKVMVIVDTKKAFFQHPIS